MILIGLACVILACHIQQLQCKNLSEIIFFPDEIPLSFEEHVPVTESGELQYALDVKFLDRNKDRGTSQLTHAGPGEIVFGDLMTKTVGDSKGGQGEISFGNEDEKQNGNPFSMIFTEGEIATNEELFDSAKFKINNISSPCQGSAEIFDSNTNKCRELLTRDECGPGEWLIVHNNTFQCQIRPCKIGYGLSNNECISLTNTTACDSNESLFLVETGEAICDCNPHFIFWQADRKCYRIGSRGPCSKDHIITYDWNTGSSECKFNPCGEKKVLYQSICYELESEGPCEEGVLDYSRLGKLECVTVSLHVLIKTPIMINCRPGTRMDMNGNCRQVFYI